MDLKVGDLIELESFWAIKELVSVLKVSENTFEFYCLACNDNHSTDKRDIMRIVKKAKKVKMKALQWV